MIFFIQYGAYPDALKRAGVFPVFKNGDESLLQNYSLISVLNFIAKIFENLFK